MGTRMGGFLKRTALMMIGFFENCHNLARSGGGEDGGGWEGGRGLRGGTGGKESLSSSLLVSALWDVAGKLLSRVTELALTHG